MYQRRTFLKKLSDSSLYILTLGAFLNHPLKGWAKWNQEAFQAKEFQKSVKAIYGSTPIESTDQIKIEAPDVAENGLSVPVSVSSSIKQIENLSIFIENNPLPLIANYHLKEGMIPEFSLRVKVAKSSNIHVMVKTADKLYGSTRKIQVTLGGVQKTKNMKKNIRIKAVEKSGIVTVKALIKHPMETGRRKDQEGNLIPMHHISEFRVLVNGIKKMDGEWGTGISKNPYMSFKFQGKKGDQIQIELLDNLKQKSSVQTIVQ